jgi:paraquat-inducible protein A
MTPDNEGLVACHECDLLQEEVALPARGEAECVRCGAELYRDKPHGLDHSLAFVVAACVVFVFANVYPLMELDARGLHTTATLYDTSRELSEAGMPSVGLLIFATAILAPTLALGAFLYMLLPLKLGRVPAHLPLAFRFVNAIRPWAMVEVFLLGALVSLVKLTQIATVYTGVALYSAGVFVMLFTAAEATFEPREMWRRVAALRAR